MDCFIVLTSCPPPDDIIASLGIESDNGFVPIVMSIRYETPKDGLCPLGITGHHLLTFLVSTWTASCATIQKRIDTFNCGYEGLVV